MSCNTRGSGVSVPPLCGEEWFPTRRLYSQRRIKAAEAAARQRDIDTLGIDQAAPAIGFEQYRKQAAMVRTNSMFLMFVVLKCSWFPHNVLHHMCQRQEDGRDKHATTASNDDDSPIPSSSSDEDFGHVDFESGNQFAAHARTPRICRFLSRRISNVLNSMQQETWVQSAHTVARLSDW